MYSVAGSVFKTGNVIIPQNKSFPKNFTNTVFLMGNSSLYVLLNYEGNRVCPGGRDGVLAGKKYMVPYIQYCAALGTVPSNSNFQLDLHLCNY